MLIHSKVGVEARLVQRVDGCAEEQQQCRAQRQFHHDDVYGGERRTGIDINYICGSFFAVVVVGQL